MEYYKKSHTLDITDCTFDSLQELETLVRPTLKNDKLDIKKIMMSKVQIDLYLKELRKSKDGTSAINHLEIVEEAEELKEKY